MKRSIIVAAVVAAAVLCGAFAAATTRGTQTTDRQPALPAADRFAPGTCRDAADAVLTLARLSRRPDVAALSTADRADLRRLQDRFVALSPAATGDVSASMQEVILALGYLRIRLDSRTAEPHYLRHLEEARSRLERTCAQDAASRGTR